MGMLKEFKDFAVKGNAVDMAVGLVIGAAFGKIVTSLVNDIIMPPLGWLIGNVDFSNLKIHLPGKVTINYGIFVNSILDFVIVAFAIFLVVKQINLLKKRRRPRSRRRRNVLNASRTFPRRNPLSPLHVGAGGGLQSLIPGPQPPIRPYIPLRRPKV